MTACHNTWRPPCTGVGAPSASPFLSSLSPQPEGRAALSCPKGSWDSASTPRLRDQWAETRSCGREDGARGEKQGSAKPTPRHILPAHVRPYLHSDGCLLGHGLVHANEGHVVVQVIDRALRRGSRCSGLSVSPLGSSPPPQGSVRGQGTYQDILDRDDRAGEGLARGHLDNHRIYSLRKLILEVLRAEGGRR